MSKVFYITAPGQPAFTVATAVATAVPSFPLGALCPSHFVLKQLFIQIAANYAKPAPNSACPVAGYTAGVFINDENFTQLAGGLLRWTRVWANVPATVNTYESYGATFPAVELLRSEFSESVTSLLQDFYCLTGPGGAFPTPGQIPVAETFRWIYANGLSFRATGLWIGSVPTLRQYMAMMGVNNYLAVIYPGQANPLAGYTLLRECTVNQYLGNLFRRRLRWTQAK
jgi:hypothetical protein